MAREYYSLPEAAALLGISRIAVFKRVKKGQLAALRFGRNWAVPAAALPAAGVGPSPAAAPTREKAARPPRLARPPGIVSPPAPDADLDSMGWD